VLPARSACPRGWRAAYPWGRDLAQRALLAPADRAEPAGAPMARGTGINLKVQSLPSRSANRKTGSRAEPNNRSGEATRLYVGNAALVTWINAASDPWPAGPAESLALRTGTCDAVLARWPSCAAGHRHQWRPKCPGAACSGLQPRTAGLWHRPSAGFNAARPLVCISTPCTGLVYQLICAAPKRCAGGRSSLDGSSYQGGYLRRPDLQPPTRGQPMR